MNIKKTIGDNKETKNSSDAPIDESRRTFLTSTTGAVAVLAGATGSVVSTNTLADDFSPRDRDPSLNGKKRARVAADIKKSLARQQLSESISLPTQFDNNDEHRYSDQNYYASFHKTLPHNDFGEVDADAFRKLQRAMRVGSQRVFDNIPLSDIAERTLANPQGAFRFEMTGLDSHATRMPAAPTFRGATTAAEMGEVYWQALTRDIPFSEYNNHSAIADAIDDLNGFSETVGPKEAGNVTANTLFRGETAGDINGPYISQLLLKDIPYGPSIIKQQYELGVAGKEYMIDSANWLHVQRGGVPLESLALESNQRYLYNNRGLSEYVHRDVLFQAYFNAALILLSMGPDALDQGNPYLSSSKESSFTSLGGPWLLQMLTYASNLSLSGAWFQKWRVHRRLRPEVFGGRINFHQVANRNYEIHPDILNSEAISKTNSIYGSSFLPMAYTEGSPTHPAYPAGHATIAGACCTVLKAFFNEDFILPDTVQAGELGLSLEPYTDTALTLGGEVDKLANNVSIGRDAAGVHYRSDGVDGLVVGEQQAIRLLKDHIQTLNEDFVEFTFTKFNGDTATITKDW